MVMALVQVRLVLNDAEHPHRVCVHLFQAIEICLVVTKVEARAQECLFRDESEYLRCACLHC